MGLLLVAERLPARPPATRRRGPPRRRLPRAARRAAGLCRLRVQAAGRPGGEAAHRGGGAARRAGGAAAGAGGRAGRRARAGPRAAGAAAHARPRQGAAGRQLRGGAAAWRAGRYRLGRRCFCGKGKRGGASRLAGSVGCVAPCCATGDSATAPCTAPGPRAALVQGPACRAQLPRPPRPPAPQVRTFDCGAQVEGPHWTLHQWTLYWEARRPLNKVRRPPGRQSRLHPLPSPPPPLLLGWCNDHALSRGRWVERRRGAQPQLRPPGTCLPCLPTAPAMLLLLLLLHVQEAFVAPPPRAALPAEDEADSAAVTRKRTADSDITGQARSCAGAVLSPGLRLGPH